MTSGALIGQLDHLDILCRKCVRLGRYSRAAVGTTARPRRQNPTVTDRAYKLAGGIIFWTDLGPR
jgi:hypothetical protein